MPTRYFSTGRQHGKSTAQDLALLTCLANALGFSYDTESFGLGPSLYLTAAPTAIGLRAWDPIHDAADFHQLVDLIGPRLRVVTVYEGSPRCSATVEIGTFKMTVTSLSTEAAALVTRRAVLLALAAYDGKLL